MEILFQNEHFIVIDKPAGTLSVPARFANDSRKVIGIELQNKLHTQVFPVHRLDFEVSGILLFALNAKAHAKANSWFENKMIQKMYEAFTTGDAPEIATDFEWKSKILRGKKRAYESPAGKPSLTKAKYLGLKQSYLHWTLEPVTGRSHQLRFDLARHEFPIVGDKLYGSGVDCGPDKIALRAVRIVLPAEARQFGLPQEILAKPLEVCQN